MTTLLLDSPLPVAAAPMAGGPTGVALARAVRSAGAFPFLAGGYKTAEALAEQITALRGDGGAFGVNLFVPDPNAALDRGAFVAYARELEEDAARYGIQLSAEPVSDDDHWAQKLELLATEPVPVVSLTFGLPPAADIARLRAAGSTVLATVTSPEEARAAQEAGVDGLVGQGSDAGGHSATYTPQRPLQPGSTPELVRRIRAAVPLPVIGTGGVDGPAAVREILAAGAESVAVGTLLLRTDESGASQTHKDALANPRFTETRITRAFTGRPARALCNAFIDRHDTHAPAGYPAIHHLTRALRQAAAQAGDPELLHLWAGTGWQHATTGPAADIVARLTA